MLYDSTRWLPALWCAAHPSMLRSRHTEPCSSSRDYGYRRKGRGWSSVRGSAYNDRSDECRRMDTGGANQPVERYASPGVWLSSSS